MQGGKMLSCYQDTCLGVGSPSGADCRGSHGTSTTLGPHTLFAISLLLAPHPQTSRPYRVTANFLHFFQFDNLRHLIKNFFAIDLKPIFLPLLLGNICRESLWNFVKTVQHTRTLTSESWLIAGRNSRQEIFIRHYLHKAWTFCPGSWHLNTGVVTFK